jgi:hypothetical protein
MSHAKLDLRPRNLRERYLQYVVNSARHAWVISFPAIGALCYFGLAARSAKHSFMYLGILFAVVTLVWLERNIAYHVLKRLQESDPCSRHDERPAGGAGAATPGQGSDRPEGEKE